MDRTTTPFSGTSGLEIAVIGMSYRFPGASNSDQFWKNLCDGVESVSFFADEELESFSGTDRAMFDHPQYVKAGAVLDGIDLFDAEFFGYSPRDAEILDPQQRLFLECAWEALEDAGYDSENYRGSIGVYAGASMSSYLINCLSDHFQHAVDPLQMVLGNDKDYLATRVSYKLNLEGPSVVVQSACSTALVAIHLACQALLSGECDIAMAGAASIRIPQKTGYYSAKGGILSPDGHCRVFDARAQGTIRGNGVGLVVLKRLADAMADRDTIHAVVKGSAVNNDGARKVGFTAPRADGQANVIRAAHFVANVEPETITLVEAHGTGTELGDPIEVEALSKAFGARTDRKEYCAIGSVKSNIGHLDSTAGLAGFIKAVLALKYRMLPPTLNFERPNPKIDFQSSPFYVNTRLRSWEGGTTPRRAATSSFGMGGTNAHAILEEPPEPREGTSSRPWQLLLLSAKSSAALDRATHRLADYLKKQSSSCLADVAYTLQVGRRAFNHRRALVCRDSQDALEALESADPQRLLNGSAETSERKIALMFSGQGAQYPNMGLELYRSENTFRKHIDNCSELLRPQLPVDLRDVMYPPEERAADAARSLNETALTQPALFVTDYALAQLVIEWGLHPTAFIGHSIGEYVAACLAGVFSLEDALALVAARGALMQQLPRGAMLSVKLGEDDLRQVSGHELSLAGVNGPESCVVSGPIAAIEEFENQLAVRNFKYQRLHTSHAFHSSMMEPILGAFAEKVRKLELNVPRIPFISNVTGDWITDAQATDPEYWARHLRSTVRFSDGVSQLLRDPDRILLEIGPGDTLASLARQHLDSAGRVILTSMRHARFAESDTRQLLTALGKAWLAGVKVDWRGFYSHEERNRVPLPTYQFERKRYWLAPKQKIPAIAATPNLEEKTRVRDWLYVPTWRKSSLAETIDPASTTQREKECVLVFLDSSDVGAKLIERLQQAGLEINTVVAGEEFKRHDSRLYSIVPRNPADYDRLIRGLVAEGETPTSILHLWNLGIEPAQSNDESLQSSQLLGFYSILFLAQALGKNGISSSIKLRVITDGLFKVSDEYVRAPERATILGPIRCIPQEYDHIACQAVDIVLSENKVLEDDVLEYLLAESSSSITDPVVAYRRGQRFAQTFEPIPEGTEDKFEMPLRRRGTYLITGGLGGVGLVLARYLSREVQANLVLTSRSALPDADTWEDFLLNAGEQDPQREIVQRLRELQEMKSEVLVIAADMADRAQMKAAVRQATARFGQIHGVIHAAGVPGSGVIQLKNPERAAAVLAPKVTGTLILDDLFRDTELDFFALCSSISSVQPQLGQADYCGANAFLDAYAQLASQQNTFAVSINWDRWNEVGMAVREDAKSRQRRLALVDGQIDHPLIDRCLVNEADRQIYETEFNVGKHWFLDEHRIVKRATLPGTVLLELARAIFEARFPTATIEMRDITFLSPLVFEDYDTKTVRTIVNKRAGLFHVRFVSGATVPTLAPTETELARLKVSVVNTQPDRRHPIEDILQHCKDGELSFGDERFDQSNGETHIQFGRRWRSLKQIYLGANQAVARLELPEEIAIEDLEKYKLHPSLLDLATSANTYRTRDHVGGRVYIPLWYKSLRIQAPLARRIYSVIKQRDHAEAPGETIVRDILIVDENGKELVSIEEFTLKRVPNHLITQAKSLIGHSASQSQPGSGVLADASDVPSADTSSNQEITYGLSSAEAVEAFAQILRFAKPQVIVSSLPVVERIEKMSSFKGSKAAEAIRAKSGLMHPRPSLASAYVAPRNEIEEMIANIWQEMLGIERVGIHDNFFELGGNSLNGIEVVAELSKALDQEISVVILYEGPTVSSLAALFKGDEGRRESRGKERQSRGERRRSRIEQRTHA